MPSLFRSSRKDGGNGPISSKPGSIVGSSYNLLTSKGSSGPVCSSGSRNNSMQWNAHRHSLVATASGGGQGQVMIQRTKEPQQIQKDATVKQIQQTKQSQGAYMAEIMKDLQTLQRQQDESNQKLELTRANKQRRAEQHALFGTKLQQLKYQNGQQRTELQRVHEMLSQGQRMLGEVRIVAGKSDGDLRELDRTFKMALRSKRVLIALQRKQVRLLDELRQKIEFVSQRNYQSQGAMHRAAKAHDELIEYIAICRRETKEGLLRKQQLADETAAMRAKTLSTEQCIDRCREQQASLNQKCNEIKERAKEEIHRHKGSEMAFVSAKKEKRRILTEIEDKRKAAADAVADQKIALKDSWRQQIEIQVSEKHILVPPNLEDGRPRAIDLDRIKTSASAEAKSLDDEVKAKQELERNLLFQNEEIARTIAATRTSSEAAAELSSANECKRFHLESENALCEEFLIIEKEVKCLRASLSVLEARHRSETALLKEQLHATSLNKANESSNLSKVQAQLDYLKTDLNEVTRQHEDAKVSGASKIEIAQQTLDEGILKSGRIIAEAEHRCKDFRDEAEDQSTCAETQAKKQEVDNLLLEYPVLENIVLEHDPHVPLDAQVQDALQPILALCLTRVESAKKMRLSLNEAAERERQERNEEKAALEAEKRHREELRERRRLRLEEEKKNSDEALQKMHVVDAHVNNKSHRETSSNAADVLVLASSAPTGELSAAKPRALAKTFAQMESILKGNNEEVPKAEKGPVHDKKVHWKDGKAQEKQSRRREAFGSSRRGSRDQKQHSVPKHAGKSSNELQEGHTPRTTDHDSLLRTTKDRSKALKLENKSSESVLENESSLASKHALISADFPDRKAHQEKRVQKDERRTKKIDTKDRPTATEESSGVAHLEMNREKMRAESSSVTKSSSKSTKAHHEKLDWNERGRTPTTQKVDIEKDSKFSRSPSKSKYRSKYRQIASELKTATLAGGSKRSTSSDNKIADTVQGDRRSEWKVERSSQPTSIDPPSSNGTKRGKGSPTKRRTEKSLTKKTTSDWITAPDERMPRPKGSAIDQKAVSTEVLLDQTSGDLREEGSSSVRKEESSSVRGEGSSSGRDHAVATHRATGSAIDRTSSKVNIMKSSTDRSSGDLRGKGLSSCQDQAEGMHLANSSAVDRVSSKVIATKTSSHRPSDDHRGSESSLRRDQPMRMHRTYSSATDPTSSKAIATKSSSHRSSSDLRRKESSSGTHNDRKKYSSAAPIKSKRKMDILGSDDFAPKSSMDPKTSRLDFSSSKNSGVLDKLPKKGRHENRPEKQESIATGVQDGVQNRRRKKPQPFAAKKKSRVNWDDEDFAFLSM